jgi:hypothetical protein
MRLLGGTGGAGASNEVIITGSGWNDLPINRWIKANGAATLAVMIEQK